MDVFCVLLGDGGFPPRLPTTRLIVMTDKDAVWLGNDRMPMIDRYRDAALPPGKSQRAVPESA